MFEPELAQAIIEQHFRGPRHQGECEAATASGDTTNPLCGDEVSVSLEIVGDGIRCARFEGQGCAVSQAGASLVVDWLQGRRVDEAVAGLRVFLEGMAGGAMEECGELAALFAVRDNAARAVCAKLAAEEVVALLATRTA